MIDNAYFISILFFMRKVEWTKKAFRQLKKIHDKASQDAIIKAVGKLADFPDCSNIKRLVNRDEYRLRVGRYRVIFTDDLRIITIEEVKIRNEQTY